MLRAVLFSCLLVCVLGRSPKILRPLFPGRIVGGQPTNITKHPWQLCLMRNGFFECGASIISKDYAITAAHCTDGDVASELTVRSGSSYRDEGGEVHKVTKIIQNPAFTMQTMDHDVSLLKVDPPFAFGNTEKAIDLASDDTHLVDKSTAEVTGWGTTSEGGQVPETLRVVKVQIVDKIKCSEEYGQLTSTMICAADPGKDSCQGDSGGPLTENEKLIGLVSFGEGCAEKGYAGVYTSVPSVRDWIKEQINV